MIEQSRRITTPHRKDTFAMTPFMRSFRTTRQTASLPYPRAAIFILSGCRNST